MQTRMIILRLAIVACAVFFARRRRTRHEKSSVSKTDCKRQSPSRASQLPKMSIAERLKFLPCAGPSAWWWLTGAASSGARGYGVTSAEGGKAGETPRRSSRLHRSASTLGRWLRCAWSIRESSNLDEDVNLKLRAWKVPENDFTKTEKGNAAAASESQCRAHRAWISGL